MTTRPEPPAEGDRGQARSVQPRPLDAIGELIGLVAHGDRQAFRRLYQLTSRRTHGMLVHIMGRADLAEDVLQDSYVAIWKKAAQFRPESGSGLAWLVAIARHRAIDRLRQLKRNPAEGGEDAADLPETVDGDCDPERYAALRRCLQCINSQHAHALMVCYRLGLTHQELAERLQVPLGTAKSWVHRGLLALRSCMERDD